MIEALFAGAGAPYPQIMARQGAAVGASWRAAIRFEPVE
jgi:hypothetical protein